MASSNLGPPRIVTLIDADVLIELQRREQAAITWAESVRDVPFHVPGIAASEGAVLYTFNLRHFSAVKGLNAIAPYTRWPGRSLGEPDSGSARPERRARSPAPYGAHRVSTYRHIDVSTYRPTQ